MPLVSIIIPVYNREKSIKFCLESISNLNCQDFEVIIIDDGSKDNSGLICRDFCNTHKNFKYYYQENSGVSNARNHGIRKASSKWITFIDSDDAVCKEHLDGLLCEEYNNNDPDLIIQGFTMIGTVGNNFEIPPCPNLLNNRVETFNPINYIFSEYNPYKNPIFSTCGKFFKLSTCIQNVIEFNERISLDEDQLFVSTYLKYVYHLVYYPKANTYLFLDWGDIHLSGKMYNINTLFNVYKINYAAFGDLYDKGGKPCINYASNYIAEKLIKYIILRYSRRRFYKQLKKNELFYFIKEQVYPILKELNEKDIYIQDYNVKQIFRLIVNKHFKLSIVYCRMFAMIKSVILKLK